MAIDDRWDRLQRFFEAALQADAAGRDALIAECAASDPDLAAQLRAMLDRADEHSVIDRPVGDVAGQILAGGNAGDMPELVGGYRTVRLLGEGGMGVVYLVERADVGGHAALKLLLDAWLSPARRDRFRREQRTLAQLRHPGIAQLHGAGTLPDGTPWFAMEYVEGEPITTWCEARALDVEGRVRLFRHVIDAVRYAHAHAIIHRDLKPSNVLVTADGTVKLLDFGIAKQVDDTDAPEERTRTGMRMLTPAYAAPEQFTGGSIGVHTDIYSLGVMLYELVTGRNPLSGARDDAAALATRERPITRPSDAARGGRVAMGRVTWPELDVVVTTAMHPDPERRYRNTEALLRDIDHYLRGEPLEARPDSAAYRASRFVRRNWRGVAVGSAAMIAIVALTAFYTVRLAGARDVARSEAERTSRIQHFMLGLFAGGDADAGPADSLRVRELIARGVREASALDAEPIVQAELRATLGTLQRQLGALASADTLLTQALDARRRLLGAEHPEVAANLTALAALRIDQARFDDAARLVADAIGMSERLLPPSDPRVIDAHATRGKLHQEQARWPEAIAEQEDVLRRLPQGSDGELRRATGLVSLASSHFYAGNLAASDSLNRIALAIYRRERGDNHPAVADVLINLGAADFERGKYADAEVHYRDAVARTRAWYGDDHPKTASALTMLGRALNFEKRDAEATAVLRQALAVQERVHGAVHPSVASALNDLANIALRNERLDEADSLWKRAESIYFTLHGERHWLLGIARSNLAAVRMARKDYRGAEPLFRQAVAIFEGSQGPKHLNSGIAHLKLGRSLLRQGRLAEAVVESKRGLDVLTALPEAPKGFIDAGRTDLAAGYEGLGDKVRAAEYKEP